MSLSDVFRQLDSFRKEIKAPLIEWYPDDVWEKPVMKEVALVDLQKFGAGGFVDNDGRNRFVVYIRDQYIGYSYRFHITNCQTLRKFHEEGRIDKYVTDTHPTNNFVVYLIGDGEPQRTTKQLCVCKNCLMEMNYKGYQCRTKEERDIIFREFSIDDFFETYNTLRIYKTKHTVENSPINEYTKDWNVVSESYRKSKFYVCENCGKNCTNNKVELHVHHIDSRKDHNNTQNLKALCRRCHEKVHGHVIF